MNKWGWTAPCRNPCMHIQLMETSGWAISLSCFIKEWKSKVQYLQMTRNIRMYRGENAAFFFFFWFQLEIEMYEYCCFRSRLLPSQTFCVFRSSVRFCSRGSDKKLVFNYHFNWDTSITNPQELKGLTACAVTGTVGGQTALSGKQPCDCTCGKYDNKYDWNRTVMWRSCLPAPLWRGWGLSGS